MDDSKQLWYRNYLLQLKDMVSWPSEFISIGRSVLVHRLSKRKGQKFPTCHSILGYHGKVPWTGCFKTWMNSLVAQWAASNSLRSQKEILEVLTPLASILWGLRLYTLTTITGFCATGHQSQDTVQTWPASYQPSSICSPSQKSAITWDYGLPWGTRLSPIGPTQTLFPKRVTFVP